MGNPVRDVFEKAIKLIEDGKDNEAKAMLSGLAAPFVQAAIEQVNEENKKKEKIGFV